MHLLDLLDGGMPVVAEAHFVRGLQHFAHAPVVFCLRDGDQFLGRVGNQRVGQFVHQGIAAHRIADDGGLVIGRDADQLFLEKRPVSVQRLVGILVGLIHPPRELGIVAVVLLKPCAELLDQVISCDDARDSRQPDRSSSSMWSGHRRAA